MKLRVKLLLGTVGLLALVLGICASVLISASFDAMMDSQRASALRTWNSVRTTIEVVGASGAGTGSADLQRALRAMENGGRALWDGVELMEGDRRVYGAGVDPEAAESQAGSCLITAFRRGETHYLQLSGTVSAGGRELELKLVSDITAVYEARAAQLSVFRRLLLAALVIGAAGSWLMATLLTRPLAKLGRASRKLAAGDLTSRADVKSGDELETLAHEFNAMADELETSMGKMRDFVDRQTAFMGSFAHELKTPMTSIIGYSDLLRRSTLTEEEAREAANYIFSESRRLEALSLKLQDLILLKKEDFELTPAEPKALLSGVVRVMRPVLTRAGVTLRYRAGEGRCLLEPDLVKSLLINLVDNARKAMDNGGAIFILAELTEEGCRFSVTDNGRGIPEADLARITEAFYRVDKSRSRAQGGVGLGLALCDEIARLHHGSLTIRSVLGRGTVITAELKGGRA